MVTIYVASKTIHAPRWRALRREGLLLGGYMITSTWIDEAGVGETTDRADLAQRCVVEANVSDCLMLYVAPGEILTGAFVEVGAALAAGHRVYVVGESVSTDCVFRDHPLCVSCASIAEAIAHAQHDVCQ